MGGCSLHGDMWKMVPRLIYKPHYYPLNGGLFLTWWYVENGTQADL